MTNGRLASRLAYGISLVLPLMSGSGAALADSSPGVDTLLGNALNPGAVDITSSRDPRGIGAFHEGPDRSPSGLLYGSAFLPPALVKSDFGWDYWGSFEAGALGGNANNDNAIFRQYKDVRIGTLLNYFSLSAEKSDEPKYVDLVGGGVGSKDQYFGLQYGRWGDYRLKFFLNDTPHTFTTSARAIWQGLGANSLTLPPGLTPGNGDRDAIQAAANSAGTAILGIVRRKGGVGFDKELTDAWSGFASYTLEKREGTRPFGGAFYFTFAPTPMNFGAAMETVEPIDYATHEIVAGLKYAGALRQFNLTSSISLFRNNIDTLTWENPFNVGVLGALPSNAPNIQRGRFALYPDNEAYNVRADYAEAFPSFYRSRLTATGSVGRMRQNEALIPPTVNTGVAGHGFFEYPFANWNTTDALSQKNAAASVDTASATLAYSLIPSDKLTLRAKGRYYETVNHTNYTALNPLTGQYGYPALDGARGTIATGEDGFYTPGGPSSQWHYRSVPFEYKQSDYSLGADYRLSTRSQVSGEYQREEFHRRYRERDRTWEDRARLAVSTRAWDTATIRLSYEHGDRRGSAYNYDPYRQFFTASLPGYPNPERELPYTLADLRKYDLADRKQDVVNARLNLQLREDLDGFVSLRFKDTSYPASYGLIGRQAQSSINFELNYQPAALMNAYAFCSRELSRLKQANIKDLSVPGSLPNAGGSDYPLANAWSVESRDRNDVFGFGAQYDFTRFRVDLKYTFANARSPIAYQGNSPGVTATTLTADQVSGAFPDLTYRQHLAEANLIFPVKAGLAVRIFYRYENTRILDWHYTGLADNLLQGQVLYMDPGPANYRANVFGVFIQYRL